MLKEYRKIGDVLLDMGLITQQQLEQALVLQKTKNKWVGEILEEMGVITAKQIAESLSEQLCVPLVDCKEFTLTEEMKTLVPYEMAMKKRIMPLEVKNDILTLAMVDPLDRDTVDSLEYTTGHNILPVVSDLTNLFDALKRNYGESKDVWELIEKESLPHRHKKMGEMLVASGLIKQKQLEQALKLRKIKNKRIGKIIEELGFATGKQVAEVLAEQLSLQYVNCGKFTITDKIKSLIPLEVAEKKLVLPLEIKNNTLLLAMVDPLNYDTIDLISFMTNLEITSAVTDEEDLFHAIEQRYEMSEMVSEFIDNLAKYQKVEFIEKNAEEDKVINVEDTLRKSESVPVVKIVTLILSNAVKSRASDIHLEPRHNHVHVRFRIDGELRDVLRIPKYLQSQVIARIKVKSCMDITKRRLPQDGNCSLIIENRNIDLRVSTLPSIYGENVVIRLLDTRVGLVPLARLGIPNHIFEALIDIFSKPQGMLLITGPTGSGKTTTLYASLNQLRNEREHIVTVEDPVEYKLDGVTQVHLDKDAGLTFSKALRSILRQDPDIIMIGEMRDRETAEIAIRATMTGHLVMSTLHTNDTVSTIARLIDLGVPPLLVSMALSGVFAQRLVRRICEKCKVEISSPSGIKGKLPALAHYYRGEGCDHCFHTGFYGRIGVYEYLEINSKLRDLISRNATESELWHAAKEAGTKTLFDDAWSKVEEGVTSVEEALSKVPLDKYDN